jgi:hypothetical protein
VDAQMIGFGVIEIDGRRYTHDVVIDGARVGKRHKKASKAHRGRYGHTPLSADEPLPWAGPRLIVGTGAYGSLPVMPEVFEEAERRGVEVVAAPTADALRLVGETPTSELRAVIHVTC